MAGIREGGVVAGAQSRSEGTEYQRDMSEFNDKYMCLQWYLVSAFAFANVFSSQRKQT